MMYLKDGMKGRAMSEWTDKSEFYHFGILPHVCIHSPIEDQYTKMYKPRDECDCGSSDWIDGTMKIIEDSMGYVFPLKNVHRCEKCKQVRMADHIGSKIDD